MLIVLILFTVYLILATQRPDIMFWLALTIFLDPGGYLFYYVGRSMIGGLQLTDVTFILLLIPLISPKINVRSFFRQPDNKWIFRYLLFFALFYHIFVFGFVTTGYDFNSFLDTLRYRRLDIWGFLAVIPAYIFFRRSMPLMLKFSVVTSTLLIILYLIRLSTEIPVLPLWTGERGLGIQAMRVSMYRYGFAYWFIYAALINYIFRLNLPLKRLIYFIGVTLSIAVILTLTRRSIIFLILSMVVIYILSQRIMFNRIISIKAARIILVAGMFLLALSIFAPSYVKHTVLMFENSFSPTGENGNEVLQADVRVDHDMPGHLARFRQKPILGYGYNMLWYSNAVEEGGLSANDVPLTAALGMFGIVGAGLFAFFYFRIIKVLISAYRVLRKLYQYSLVRRNAIMFTILLALIVNFLSTYTISFMSFFTDIVDGPVRVVNMIYVGFLLASRDMLSASLATGNQEPLFQDSV